MPGRGQTLRAAALVLLGALALSATPITVASAGSSDRTCRVRNVTQDTRGGSFARMIAAARDGDRLRVRGTCVSTDVVIQQDLTIIGVDDDAVLHGLNRYRVLRITRHATVTIRHLRLARGSSSAGGAIHNRGDLTLVDVIVQRNHGSSGGGIWNAGDLRIMDSVVRRNSSWYAGGLANGGTVTMIRTRVTDNRGEDQGEGGGIVNGGTLTLMDSVVARNRVLGGAAGISNLGTLTLIRSSIRDNRSGGLSLDDAGGGGIQNSGELVLRDSHVTGNSVGRGPGGGSGGGIFNWPDDGTVTLEGTSSVTGNTPDDCVGTPAC